MNKEDLHTKKDCSVEHKVKYTTDNKDLFLFFCLNNKHAKNNTLITTTKPVLLHTSKIAYLYYCIIKRTEKHRPHQNCCFVFKETYNKSIKQQLLYPFFQHLILHIFRNSRFSWCHEMLQLSEPLVQCEHCSSVVWHPRFFIRPWTSSGVGVLIQVVVFRVVAVIAILKKTKHLVER